MRWVRPLLVSTTAVAVATVIKVTVPALRELPFLLYFAPVLVAALADGALGGFAATLLSAAIANVFFIGIPGTASLYPTAILQTLAFVFEGATITLFATGLRRARDRVSEAQGRFRAVFEESVDGIVLSDPTHAVVDLNPAASAILGQPRERILGRRLDDLVTYDASAPTDAALAKPSPVRQAHVVTPEGGERYVEVAETHEVMPGIELTMVRDVDARQRIEQRLRFLEEASRILASSLDVDETLGAVTRLAVPRMADWCAIDLLDAGKIRRVSVAHVDPNKVELAYAIWRHMNVQLDDPSGVGRVIRDAEAEVVFDLAPDMLDAGVPDVELRAMLKSLGLVSSMILPLRTQGATLGAITLASAESRRRFDARDLAFAEELARRAAVAVQHALAYREAREANRVKDEFLATVSHELRTPLNAILGWAVMLRTGRAGDVDKAVATIERNARAQVRLIEDVLDVSRIITGKLTLDRRPIDVTAVLRAAIEAVAPAANAKNIVLEPRFDCDSCVVEGDPDRLQQVFWNLLSNAVKFTPSGGHVGATLGREGPRVVVRVRDDGRGISPSLLPHVFDRFRQGDSSTTRAQGGLGLGLAIARHLIEQHQGTITAESPGEGRGATFTVSLPVSGDHATAGAAFQGELPAEDPRRPLAGVRVLVCDDDPDARDLFRTALGTFGADVCVTADAEETIAQLRAYRPDVLVSDIGLPRVDGYELMRRVRALPAEHGGRTPSIAVTAYARGEDERRAFVAGFQKHLAKPVEPRQLAELVANLAGRPLPSPSIPG